MRRSLKYDLNAEFEKKQQKCLIKHTNDDIINMCYKEGRSISMLLEFSCENHKSIKERVLFSTVAGKDNTNENELFPFGSNRVLKTAVIYGANGSGKSNFIDAVAFVKHLVTNSIKYQPGDAIWQNPHKLSGRDSRSTYAIQFVTENTRFAFGFTLKQFLIEEEYLYYFPNGRQVKIFERDTNGFKAGDKFKNKFETCHEVLKPNRLMLSCVANFSNVPEVAQAFRFFRDDLVIYRGMSSDNWMNYSLKEIHSNPNMKSAVLAFMRDLGTGIRDIKVKIDQVSIPINDIPPFLSDEFKAVLMNDTVEHIEAKVVYDSFETDLLSEESLGIRKLFEMLCPFIDIIVRGKVLICDELEASLHEAILYGMVDMFRQLKSDRFAQLIFTTHDTSILDLDLFRRDQIWFTELTGETRSTELYSLAEIKNVRKDENVGKGYIAGKYGAIPMLNINLAQIISEQ